MKRIGIVKGDTLVSLINLIGIPSTVAYIASMVIAPVFIGQFDWNYIQNVWDRWQTFNVGILAFISSAIAFNISKYNENKQRERRFVAARAFLPHALSELTSYCNASSVLLNEAWDRLGDTEGGRAAALRQATPDLPDDYKDIFSHCIAEAEFEVGNHLARILVALQVHHSRLKELECSFSQSRRIVVVKPNIVSYLYCLGELQALINRVFNFARGLEEFNESDLTIEEFETAYFTLDIHTNEIDDLLGFTKRAIARNSSK